MNKQDNVPQVKTVERTHAEDVLFKFVQTVHNLGDVVNAMEEYAAQETASLKSRIAELEAERDKYREALEQIKNHNADNLGWREIGMNSVKVAEQALNSKEVGGE